MDKLLFVTHNKHKLKEVRTILSEYDIEIISLKELGLYYDDPIESGSTYYENALIKARKAREYSSLPIISDDSGIEITMMNNKPGLFSARFAKNLGGNPEAFKEIFKRIEGKNREARFICSLCYLDTKNKDYSFLGVCPGKISTFVDGEDGFGYDPIFIPEGYDKSFARMGDKEKNKISHRARALFALMKYLKVEKKQ